MNSTRMVSLPGYVLPGEHEHRRPRRPCPIRPGHDPDRSGGQGGVSETSLLATAHATEGLEGDHVAVLGMTEGRFPNAEPGRGCRS